MLTLDLLYKFAPRDFGHTNTIFEFAGSADVYGLARSSPRGIAFIINIRRGRPGSEKDVALMTSLFSSMNYEVRKIEDQTKEVGALSGQHIFLGYKSVYQINFALSWFPSALNYLLFFNIVSLDINTR